MAIPQEIIDSVRERTSISEVISERVTLKRVGRNLVGLCPFHSEKTGSFNVREEEGTYHCFGCGKKGSVFDFVMETRGFSFVEAVTFLANKLGIRIPENSPWVKKEKSESGIGTKLRKLAYLVAEVYSETLWGKDGSGNKDGARAREYLSSRGVSEQIARLFHFGYAPSEWEFLLPKISPLAERLERAGLSSDEIPKLLMSLGLVKARKNESGEKKPERSEGYDIFRDRLMFGITRSDGAVIGFGGRILEKRDDAPKYINSPESPIYHKRKTFFGLSQAVDTLRKTGHVYVVEGYMDVVGMVQRDFRATVATCGTALTPDHVSVLKRLVNRATILFDGDAAGYKAAASCFEAFLNSSIEISAVLLEGDEDPDSLARKTSADEMQKLFDERRVPLIDVFIRHRFRELETSPESAGPVIRGRVAEALGRALRNVQNPVERESYLKRAAELVGVNESSLEAIVRGGGKIGRGDRAARPSQSESAPPADYDLPPTRTAPMSSPRKAPPLRSGSRPLPPLSNSRLNPFTRALIVAVLIEPSIAQEFLKLTCKDDPQMLVLDRLPGWIQELVSDVVHEMPEGVQADRSIEIAQWRDLLARYQLADERLIEEALERAPFVVSGRERMVDELLKQAPIVAGRTSVMAELAQLKQSEKGVTAETERTRLIQEKIEKRKQLRELSRE